MKFRVQLKDPDGFYEGTKEAAEQSLSVVQGISKQERESLLERRIEQVRDGIDRWVEYGEYVTIEFDTEAGTATVVELGK